MEADTKQNTNTQTAGGESAVANRSQSGEMDTLGDIFQTAYTANPGGTSSRPPSATFTDAANFLPSSSSSSSAAVAVSVADDERIFAESDDDDETDATAADLLMAAAVQEEHRAAAAARRHHQRQRDVINNRPVANASSSSSSSSIYLPAPNQMECPSRNSYSYCNTRTTPHRQQMSYLQYATSMAAAAEASAADLQYAPAPTT